MALGTRLGTRLGTALGTALDDASEAPLLIADLAAWYDSRTDAYFTLSGSNVTAWASRAGSMGATPISQGTALSQPTRATAVASLGGKNAVLFDGTSDFMSAATAADWTFLHNNSGATVFSVERFDSTGPANQVVLQTFPLGAATSGVYHNMRTTTLEVTIGNGSGTYQNNWGIVTAAHFAKDVSRWRSWSYGSNAQTSRVSGSTLTSADVGGQVPSVVAPVNGLRLGRGSSATSSLKGHLAQLIVFKRVLSAAEITSLGTWAASVYGVAA